MPADPVPALKAQLGGVIARELAGWRASDLMTRLEIDVSRISELRRGKLDRFSLAALVRIAARLRYRADLTLTKVRIDSAAPRSAEEAVSR